MALTNKLKAIADGFRSSRGLNKELSLDEMAALASEPVGTGGEQTDFLASRLLNTLTEYKNSEVTSIPKYAFDSCSKLTSVDFPNVTTLKEGSFYNCTALSSVRMPSLTTGAENAFFDCRGLKTLDFPLLKSVSSNMFYRCYALTEISLPSVTSINNNGFANCTKLSKADFAILGGISAYAFKGCSLLTALILRNTEKVCYGSTTGGGPLGGTPIASGTGYIYVPKALLDSYKAHTTWVAYADQFRAIEDYPDICG